jgi:hypothetical protein
MHALDICGVEGFPVIGSPTVILEINNIKSDMKRRQVMGFYVKTVTAETPLTAGVEARAGVLSAQGMGRIDAYHAALSENAGIDILLTTDYQFESAAARLNVKTKVINPINFLQEYMKWLQSSM